MKTRNFEIEQWLPLPQAQVFAFFADAGNLDGITPPWLNFRIETPLPIAMRQGALIDYSLKIHGLPIHWRTAITHWNPPHAFVDEQVRGPYRRWIHHHTFEDRDGGTRIVDRVEYAVPGWILEPVIHRLFVGPDLQAIFDYRRRRIADLLLPAVA